MKSDTRTPIRHGELLLIPVEQADMSSAVTKKNYVVSHSETGHHHVIDGEVAVLEAEGQDPLIRAEKPTKVVHKKGRDRHADLPLREGIWRAVKKREYDPFQKAMREVWD